MKTDFIKTLLLLLFFSLIDAQGQTLFFEVNLDSLHAVPPNQSSMSESGSFGLESGSRFSGRVFSRQFTSVTAISLFRSDTASVLGTKVVDLTPGGIIPGDGDASARAYTIDVQILQPQVDDLIAGRWWVNLSTAAFPNGEIRGQIIQVPEPSTYAMAAFALLGISFLNGKTRNRWVRNRWGGGNRWGHNVRACCPNQ
jgi:hypothetical protein